LGARVSVRALDIKSMESVVHPRASAAAKLAARQGVSVGYWGRLGDTLDVRIRAKGVFLGKG
jgi:hypothetical protein